MTCDPAPWPGFGAPRSGAPCRRTRRSCPGPRSRTGSGRGGCSARTRQRGGGPGRPLLREPRRRDGELGVVVEHHHQVVVLGQRHLGLDRGQVGRAERGPGRAEQAVLAQLQPDGVGAPGTGGGRDLLHVQLDRLRPVQELKAGHGDPVGHERLAVLVEHLGALHAERAGGSAARLCPRPRGTMAGCTPSNMPPGRPGRFGVTADR
jgi:hypothetical protein